MNIIRQVEREKLLSEIMPQHDVILHPTYMDSFGIAPYEAVNLGLAGIVTDMYAIPEFINHEKNGFLMESPINYFDRDNNPNLKFWLFTNIENYVKQHNFDEIEKKLVEYMQYYIDNPAELKKHQKYSKKLSEENFSLFVRNKKLLKIYREVQ